MKAGRILFFAVTLFVALTSSAIAGVECPPTQNDVEGPYYLAGAPFRTEIAGTQEAGERVVMRGSVMKTDCRTPLKEALVEVWQTDAAGIYYYQDEGYRLRGQMKTDENGGFAFHSIKPGRYRIMDGFRPAHIHIKVSHPDYEVLTTQIYFQGDPYLWPNDACGSGCRSNDPKRIIALTPLKGRADVLEGKVPVFLKKRLPNK
jgi:protocatechuate 3,4-dioxygenase beta subunit